MVEVCVLTGFSHLNIIAVELYGSADKLVTGSGGYAVSISSNGTAVPVVPSDTENFELKGITL